MSSAHAEAVFVTQTANGQNSYVSSCCRKMLWTVLVEVEENSQGSMKMLIAVLEWRFLLSHLLRMSVHTNIPLPEWIWLKQIRRPTISQYIVAIRRLWPIMCTQKDKLFSRNAAPYQLTKLDCHLSDCICILNFAGYVCTTHTMAAHRGIRCRETQVVYTAPMLAFVNYVNEISLATNISLMCNLAHHLCCRSTSICFQKRKANWMCMNANIVLFMSSEDF